MNENPFQAPATSDNAPLSGSHSESERIRRAHLWHERGIRWLGILYAILSAGFFWLAFDTYARGVENSLYAFGLLAAAGITGAWCFHGMRRLAGWTKWPVVLLAGLGLLISPLLIPLNGVALFLVYSAKGRFVLSPTYKRIIREARHVESAGIPAGTMLAVAIVSGLFLLMIITLLAFAGS